jgi:HSP20 family protein
MASFFEKLKKGMGIEETGEIEEASFAEDSQNETEEPEETTVSSRVFLRSQPASEETEVSSSAPFRGKSASEEKPARKKRTRKPRKIEVGEDTAASPAPSRGRPTVEEQLIEAKAEQKKPSFTPVTTKTLAGKKNIEVEEKWLEAEGELAIDVYQTENEVVIQSAIAGVRPENLDIAIERDILTIRGNREKPFEESGDYFTQECYWGPFSREVVMPVEVDPERVEATMKDGILTIRIPKMLREKLRKIKVRI